MYINKISEKARAHSHSAEPKVSKRNNENRQNVPKITNSCGCKCKYVKRLCLNIVNEYVICVFQYMAVYLLLLNDGFIYWIVVRKKKTLFIFDIFWCVYVFCIYRVRMSWGLRITIFIFFLATQKWWLSHLVMVLILVAKQTLFWRWWFSFIHMRK